ncbi:TSUP family transporter [Caballeronia novacaledonica]|uniref:TSUP family transporter n=1 Tax=Caballeronia novacaledonica TaxID=1544861 RepID=UPI003857EB2A
MFSSLALSYITAWRERKSLDRRGVSLALIGRVPGALLAGLALGLFAARTYDVVFGSLIIVATVVSLWRGGVQPTPIALVGAGFASGFIGTLTAVGGPPMALVYQNANGPTLRSTLRSCCKIKFKAS